jgi:hypothetical protein
MTKVLFHGSIEGFRGRIGNMIFRRLPDGTTVVSQAPPKKDRRQKKRAKLKRSDRQKAHNERFQKACMYARWASREKPIYAELAAATTMRTTYNFALSDWFEPPVIHRIEQKDGTIRVEVTDNVMVAKVQVTVLDEGGQVLEKGVAQHRDGNWWEFPCNGGGTKVLAEAWDLLGNIARFDL